MYKQQEIPKTELRVNKSIEGETIETKVRRIMNNNEAIKDGAPIIYSDRKDGVIPEYDIRSDRFDLAIDAMDKLHSDHLAKRDERMNPKPAEVVTTPDGGSVPATTSVEVKN